ncbi:MAG: glycoside hydrolase family 15 protein [Parcubacteria group bacterium]|nr:glycoside hydrolase family 15 protein [Parcubacteria group bacterium]
MPRSLILGNTQMLVCFDADYRMQDLYFPRVGLENHISRHGHLIGVWADGEFSWVNQKDWKLSIQYISDTLVSDVRARNDRLQVELHLEDIVYNEDNIFLRQCKIKNLAGKSRDIRIFFVQEFPIYEVTHGNTAFYDPRDQVIIHYKGRRVFLVNGFRHKKAGFDDYTCGVGHWKEYEGSFKDAEDGELHKNAIEHGFADSVAGFHFKIKGGESEILYYWIAVGVDLKTVKQMNQYIIKKSPSHLIRTTRDFWRAWLSKQSYNFFDLDPKSVALFQHSLLFLRILTDKGGAMLASPDSDILQFGRDTYAYMWPRDAAFVALALDKVGYHRPTRSFFELCNELLTEEGFLMHKYLVDGSLGSSWHSWVVDGKTQYPFQEDETALVLIAMAKYYDKTRSVELVENFYNSLIKKAADFLADYRDAKTKLPLPSYDLWEERLGIHTFTCAAVYGALEAAAFFGRLLGKSHDCKKYGQAAAEIKKAARKYLYDKGKGYYLRRLYQNSHGKWVADDTLDISSFYGVLRFQIEDAQSERLASMYESIKRRLMVKTDIGGVARYDRDVYQAVSDDWENVPGNPWFLCTLWLADYHIAKAKKREDLKEAKDLIDWAVRLSSGSFILSEQVHPYTGAELSVSPLTWSHAQFVLTVLFYINRLAHFERKSIYLPFKLPKHC